MAQIYAHSIKGLPLEEWQTLHDHLQHTAQLAGEFAESFQSPRLASLIASIHDIGKASCKFQDYLATTLDSEEDDDEHVHGKGPDHSTAAAQWVDKKIKGGGCLLAYVLAGHHAGIPDGISGNGSSLECRLKKQNIPDWQVNYEYPLPQQAELISAFKMEAWQFVKEGGFATAFYLRMLFSCLVDADFLDSERVMDTQRAQERQKAVIPSCNQLLDKLETYYKELDENIQQAGRNNDNVMVVRNEVRYDCEKAADNPTGLFTLKVPTGGGKTLSSMLFALKHACKHHLERVIYVVPFTTIIEQTAEIYREIFGDEAVLEIHCNMDSESMTAQSKLLSENWDAPIIVTTNVQFFESLFSNRASRCRKLHNMTKAVIILDEAQGIPLDLLKPCLKSLEELTLRYDSSVVLCTATLPVFFDKQILGDAALTGGKNGIVDIIPPERNLHARLKRVAVSRLPGKVSDEELVEQIQQEDSVLVVVSTRRHARELYTLVKNTWPEKKTFHLSAQMCGVHRTEVLDEVKRCLSSGMSCILVSTQLIEAGVDIDFPCVFREIAGVDSMAQAAGRCNREGKIKEGGKVILFESADFEVPAGYLRMAAQQGRLTLLQPDISEDLLGTTSIQVYFKGLYSDVNKGNTNGMDKYSILSELIPREQLKDRGDILRLKFKTIGEQFKIIENNSCNVIIPYNEEGFELCEKLRHEYVPSEQRKLAHKLQRYTVSVYGSQPIDKEGRPLAEFVHDTYWILTSTTEQYYSQELGLSFQADSSTLMC